jgi:DNA ligase-1
MSKFRPLLAEKVDLATLEYPCFASPKYDGFRCIIDPMGQPVSRNMKPIANAYVYGKLKELGLPKFDGELLTYTGNKVDDFNTVQSKLSTRSGMPDFRYMVFDHYAMPNQEYADREITIREWFEIHEGHVGRLEHVQQKMVHDEEELLNFEAECLAEGWEGVMVRSIDGPYKFGRSTTREGILLKLKRFFDAEAVVVSAHELRHNANEAVTNELGYTERSSHKANMQGMDTLGKFTVQWGGVEFDIGTGFSASQRDEYWRTQDLLIGAKLTFKYQSLGPSGKPRFPVFLGFRNDV